MIDKIVTQQESGEGSMNKINDMTGSRWRGKKGRTAQQEVGEGNIEETTTGQEASKEMLMK